MPKQSYDSLESSVRRTLKTRAKYFNLYSTFNKCPSCEYNCCESNLAVQVSLTDIACMSLSSGLTPSQLYERFIEIQAVHLESRDNFHWDLRLGLKKPCGFFKNKQCSIYTDKSGQYPGRPISCAIFPEAIGLADADKKGVSEDSYIEVYPCVAGLQISDERKYLLNNLAEAFKLETRITSILAFGYDPYIIDIHAGIEQMAKAGVLKDEEILTQFLEKKVVLTDKQKIDDKEKLNLPKLVQEILCDFMPSKYRRLQKDVITAMRDIERNVSDALFDLFHYIVILRNKVRALAVKEEDILTKEIFNFKKL